MLLGKMIDYVKCLECGTEKSREDTFLDIPLPVRPFGSNIAYNSVVKYIKYRVRSEIPFLYLYTRKKIFFVGRSN